MTRTRLSPERRRAQILQATIRCFSKHGPSVSTGTIAAEAGISEALVFHYFPTRDDLWLAVATRSSSIAARTQQIFESLGDGPLEQELTRLSSVFSHAMVEEREIVAILLSAGLREEGLGPQIRQGHIAAAQTLAAALETRGGLREGVNAEAAALGFIGGLVMCFFVHHRTDNWEPIAQDFTTKWVRAWCLGAVEDERAV